MNQRYTSHERGAAGISAIIALIILAAAIYVGITMIPIYSAHYKLEDRIKEDILYARQRFTGGELHEQFRKNVIGYLDAMPVTYDKDNVRVDVNTAVSSIKVQLWYARQHKIPGFPKQFSLTVEGKYGL